MTGAATVQRSEVEEFRVLVERRLGLQFDDGRLDYLSEVLQRRMETSGSQSFEAYSRSLTSTSRDSREVRALAEQLTVSETFFFRNPDNFRALVGQVLPARLRARGSRRQLRLLSAGCASGEEPYSLAILLREALPDLASWDVQIRAVDVNPAVIARASKARYSTWSLRSTPDPARQKYFRAEGREYVLDSGIREMVTFEERNLTAPDPLFWQSLQCDVIFCRNVLMYFTPEVMRSVVERVARALLPGGFLFLGHAETLRGLSQEFHLRHTHDTFYYQRRDGLEELPPGLDPWSAADPMRGAADPLPAAFASADSWVEAIQQASERIAALANGRGEGAEENLGGASAPSEPPPGAPDFETVLAAMREERFSLALELLTSLPADAHGQPDALLLRAALLTNGARIGEAEEVCSTLLAVDELNAGAHYLMALCREHAGDPQGAQEHDLAASHLDPGFAMPHLHLGLAARRAGDAATAERELSQARGLLSREEASRLLLFGGGFSREMLLQLCQAELRRARGEA